jgi:hypothetical protein
MIIWLETGPELKFGFQPDMEIPMLIWIWYGNSGSDMEIPDLKWKIRI